MGRAIYTYVARSDPLNKLGIVHCTYLGVSGYNFQSILYSFLCIFFTFKDSVDPTEMQHGAAFNLSLNCFQNHSLRGFSNTKPSVKEVYVTSKTSTHK